MNGFTRRRPRRWSVGLVALTVGLAVAVAVPAAGAGRRTPPPSCHERDCIDVRFQWMQGFNDPATPDNLDRVGVLKVGSDWAPQRARAEPRDVGRCGVLQPLAKDIVRDTTGGRWQVWSVERRENQLEDQSVLDKAKHGKATPQQLVRLLPRLAHRPERSPTTSS